MRGVGRSLSNIGFLPGIRLIDGGCVRYTPAYAQKDSAAPQVKYSYGAALRYRSERDYAFERD